MKHLFVLAALGCAPMFAQATCQPISGTVQLLPADSCAAIEAELPGVFFLGQCFSVNLSVAGFPVARGHAGLTSEIAANALGDVTTTPLFIPEDTDPAAVRQAVMTARSAISVGWGRFRTTLYTSDVITVSRPQFGAFGELTGGSVTEQITITHTSDQGPLRGATGTMTVLGNSIGQSAPVVGELCL